MFAMNSCTQDRERYTCEHYIAVLYANDLARLFCVGLITCTRKKSIERKELAICDLLFCQESLVGDKNMNIVIWAKRAKKRSLEGRLSLPTMCLFHAHAHVRLQGFPILPCYVYILWSPPF